MKQLTVAADVGRLNEVKDFVRSSAKEGGASEETLFAVDIAVEELFVNIAMYAYPEGTGDVTVACAVSGEPKTLTFTFSDSGIPFDPLAKKDADISPDALLSRVGGLGILMAKKYTDRMTYAYENGKNVLTVSKTLK